MADLREAGVDEEAGGSTVAEPVVGFDVVVVAERDVVQHDQQVSDGQSCQDHVGGRFHLLPRQHHYVESVGYGPEDANQPADVPVDLKIKQKVLIQSTLQPQLS